MKGIFPKSRPAIPCGASAYREHQPRPLRDNRKPQLRWLTSLCLDSQLLDDWPPFLGIGPLHRTERLRRLPFTWGNAHSSLDEPRLCRGIGKRFHCRRVELANNVTSSARRSSRHPNRQLAELHRVGARKRRQILYPMEFGCPEIVRFGQIQRNAGRPNHRRHRKINGHPGRGSTGGETRACS
jgi:hypothetical protein